MDAESVSMIVGVLFSIVVQILVLVVVVRFVVNAVRGRGGHGDPFADPRWFMSPAASLTDLLRQLLAIIGVSLAVIAISMVSQQSGLGIPNRYLALLGWVLAVAIAYHQRAPLVLGFGILGAIGWWLSVATTTQDDFSSGLAVAGVALLACTAWLLGRAHDADERSRRFGFVYWVLGATVLTVLMFSVSSYGPGSSFDGSRAAGGTSPELWISFGVLASLLGASALLALRRRAVLRAELAWLLGISALLTVFAIVGEMNSVAWVAILSAVLLASLVGLAYLGFARREDWLVTLSAVLLFVFVIVKYFDWVFTFMDRSLAFVIAGLLFIGFGFAMERGRRRILAAMEEPVSNV